MMHGNGMGFNWKGLYTTSLLDAHANWRARADELSRTLKISMLAGEYFIKHHRGHFYAKAQNLGRLLRKTYDDALARYDLLLMPTLPMKATPLPPANAPLALWCQRGFRNAAEYMSIRCDRPSGDEYTLRHERRTADRHDACRQTLRRDHPLSGRPYFRTTRRLAEFLIYNPSGMRAADVGERLQPV